MKILERNYHDINNALISLIAITLIFRKVNTVLILFFAIFNILYINKLNFNKKKLYFILIITSPLLLNLLFIFNNDSLLYGFKATEKYFSLLVFSVVIIGQKRRINLDQLFSYYSKGTALILVVLFFRYIVLFNDNFLKYLSGKHLWEMGYNFANSFGAHAPALNLHMAFVSIVSLYLLLKSNKDKGLKKAFHLVTFFISFGVVLYVNTRVSIIMSLVGFCIIFIYFVKNSTFIHLTVKRLILYAAIIIVGAFLFTQAFPFTVKKFTNVTFSNMDMVGRLDEFENPEKKIFNSLVTRLTIWQSAYELSKESAWIGFGASDSKTALNNYYKKSDQKFLYKYKFPVHNQFLDFLLKFGILGLLVVFIYILSMGFLGIQLRHPIPIIFCVLFFVSNITDDFLISYSGIVFSGFWFSIFANCYLNHDSKQQLEI
ncbi:O-antigen ligase family protein [Hanstruepera ponticola]|uniref:O-antigen ligase family protein n=1 Tax=Hanstruepera ponticola TaxID=2042995 RepID=UPI001782CC90|nr:O-antigen ligase family protein [Hanstruepera ponticola]